jgi:hypothetical protein
MNGGQVLQRKRPSLHTEYWYIITTELVMIKDKLGHGSNLCKEILAWLRLFLWLLTKHWHDEGSSGEL